MSERLSNVPRTFRRPATARPLDESYCSWSKNYQRLFIDLGCGVGYHPIQLAQQHPDTGIVAIERTRNKFLSLQRRIQSHDLENIFGVYSDAINWVPDHLPEESLDRAYFLYPNPYPKESQANKRWHRQAFFHSLLSKIKKGGQLTFATNEEWLHEECEHYMLKHWKLHLASKAVLTYKDGYSFRTHFEKKYLLRGQSCFNLEFIKK